MREPHPAFGPHPRPRSFDRSFARHTYQELGGLPKYRELLTKTLPPLFNSIEVIPRLSNGKSRARNGISTDEGAPRYGNGSEPSAAKATTRPTNPRRIVNHP